VFPSGIELAALPTGGTQRSSFATCLTRDLSATIMMPDFAMTYNQFHFVTRLWTLTKFAE
jgi:hypothetical protein